MGRYCRVEYGQSQRSRAHHNSHRLVVGLFEQIINVINDVIRAHGTDDVLHGLRPREAVELLGAMNTRELEDQCEAQCGVILHTRDDIRSLIIRRLARAWANEDKNDIQQIEQLCASNGRFLTDGLSRSA